VQNLLFDSMRVVSEEKAKLSIHIKFIQKSLLTNESYQTDSILE